MSSVLKLVEKEKTASLRERMNDAGCVFKFLVLAPESTVDVNEGIHRQALNVLYEMLLSERLEWHENLIKDPEYQNTPKPLISWNLESAVAIPLSRDEVRSLIQTDRTNIFERLALYASFLNPPYRAHFRRGESEAQSVFYEWCELLGLNDPEDIVVVNWVDALNSDLHSCGDEISGVVPWSDYFDAGLEWWGVWCLTIWNPKRRTVSALIASTTD
ncbi:hypothetical protein ACYZTL_13250 [Pseudomonas sp. LB3P81]